MLCTSVSKVTVLGTSVSPVGGVYTIRREQGKSEDKRAGPLMARQQAWMSQGRANQSDRIVEPESGPV